MNSFFLRLLEKLWNQWSPLFTAVVIVCVVCSCYIKHHYDRRKKKHPQREIMPPKRQFTAGDPEVIIIGSGVAGSALAAVLGRDGRRVTVVERDMAEPDRIVGELLQPGGVAALERLGLTECLEGFDAHTVKGYIIHDMDSGSQVHIPYPPGEEEGQGTGGGPKVGRAFHHGRFVMALRQAARQEPNVHYIEGSATKLLEDNGVVVGVQFKRKDTEMFEEVHAPLTIVVDGCFSRFRKDLVREPVQVSSHFVGALMHHCPQAMPNHAELVLLSPSPVLVYQISSEDTRVLVDIRGAMPKDVRDHLLRNILPQLPEHMQEPFRAGVESGRVRTMPNSLLPPSVVDVPGVAVLGDAFNMRHPLTGGGMSVALSDVAILRDLLRRVPRLHDYGDVTEALRALHRSRKEHSFVVNVLAQALYEIFAASNEHLQSLKRACLQYLKLGGQCVSGPISLLSVLSPKPHVLILHFLAVAVYAVYHVLRAETLWGLHRGLVRSYRIFCTALSVLLPLVWNEVKSHLLLFHARE